MVRAEIAVVLGFAFLLAALPAHADDKAIAEWERLIDLGEQHLGYRDVAVTDEAIRKAERVFKQAVEVALRASLPKLAVQAESKRVDCLMALYDYAGLLEVSYEILDIQRRMGKGAEKDTYVTFLDIGYLLHKTGHSREALPILVEATQWFAGQGESCRHDFADGQARLADVWRSLGQYAKALRNAESALAIQRKGKDVLSIVEALGVLGGIHAELGNEDQAEKLYREALKLLGDGDPAWSNEIRGDLAGLTAARKDYAKAETELIAVAKFFHAEKDSRSEAWTCLRLAYLEQRRGNHAKVVEWCRKAGALAADDPAIRARAAILSGNAHLESGRVGPARKSFELALALADASDLPRMVSLSEGGLAGVLLAEGKAAEAVPHLRRGLDATTNMALGLSPLSGLEFQDRVEDLYDRAVVVAFTQKDPKVTFELLERTRGSLLLEKLGGRDLLLADDLADADARALAAARAAVRSASHAYQAAVAAEENPEIRRTRAALDQATVAYNHTWDRCLGARPAGLLAASIPLLDLEAAQRSLHPVKEAMALFAIGGGKLYALVVRFDRITICRLGPQADIEAKIRAVCKAIVADTDKPDWGPLRKAVIDPLKLDGKVERLLVSPDGMLAMAPLPLLDEGREIVFIPSATSWALLRKAEGDRGKGILAMGDPDYSSDDGELVAKLHRGRGRMRRLAETRKEILATTGPGDVRLLGKDATETGLRKALPGRKRWRAVHFACHGIVDPRNPAWSSLALTPEENGEDGFLTVSEILGMRIPADLAVLSACETGVGKTVKGEGLVALPGAFLHAGTKRVIASLWKVEEKATRQLMEEFYARWGKDGRGAAAALREAQQAIRKKGFDHPRYWAAWVLWGLPD
jgi:tetratricopeptide (TPR) repeat protein